MNGYIDNPVPGGCQTAAFRRFPLLCELRQGNFVFFLREILPFVLTNRGEWGMIIVGDIL